MSSPNETARKGSRGLIYDPATGTYTRPRKQSQTAPPPLPPKETNPSHSNEYIYTPITKETHQVSELEGDTDAGGFDPEESYKSERRRWKEKQKAKKLPKKKRQVRILSLGTCTQIHCRSATVS